MAVIEERAPELAEHVRSVEELAQATAVELGVEGGELEALRHAARSTTSARWRSRRRSSRSPAR